MTTTYPIKPPLYAITKATNYLPNVLMQMEAKEAGLRQRRLHRRRRPRRRELQHERRVRQADGVLRHPKFDHILSGCTSLRLLELARAAARRGAC